MRKKPMPPKSKPFISIGTALVIVLLWSLAGCKTPPAPLPPAPVRSVQIPPLPSYARQPTTPSVCWPTCLDALTHERESWQTWLNSGALPAELVNVPTTKPAKP